MKHRRFLMPVIAAALVGAAAAACGGDPPPEPTPPPMMDEDSARRADSIAEAERRRQDSIREAEAEAAAQRERVAAARATLEETVYFDYDESAIRPDAERVLRQKVEILRNSPAVQVRIEGHADERGSTEYNLALSNRRAEAVRQFFTGFGLDASRFTIVPYGEERPAATGSNEQAWSRNRRAEFVITAGADQINPPM